MTTPFLRRRSRRQQNYASPRTGDADCIHEYELEMDVDGGSFARCALCGNTAPPSAIRAASGKEE